MQLSVVTGLILFLIYIFFFYCSQTFFTAWFAAEGPAKIVLHTIGRPLFIHYCAIRATYLWIYSVFFPLSLLSCFKNILSSTFFILLTTRTHAALFMTTLTLQQFPSHADSHTTLTKAAVFHFILSICFFLFICFITSKISQKATNNASI